MDRIDLLESKVRDMLGAVQRLHAENASLRTQLAEAEQRLSALAQERSVLDQERDVVRDRIEQLLGDIARVGAADPGTPAETRASVVQPAAATHPPVEAAAGRRPETVSTPFRALDGGRAGHGGDYPVNPVLPGLG
ncbi:MAG: cell division protein ZapB [Nitrospirae bacterium]|nr:cell division protein ZapB [Nitrospirota bacterium]